MASECPYKSGIDYPETWKVIMTAEEIQGYVKSVAATLDTKFGSEKVILVCILKGAAWFFVDLTRHLRIPNYTTYFVEASSYKDAQTQQEKIEILSIIRPEKFVGRKVVLIDELFDNGTTMENLKVAICKEAQVPYEDITTCTLFKKNRGPDHVYPGTLDVFGVEMPNVWGVGYGLDDNQTKRGWNWLFAVPKAPGIPWTEDDHKIFGS